MTCRHPEKQQHPDEATALRHIGALWASGKGSPDMSAYPCDDHWHIGHDAKKFQDRIRRSIRTGRGPKTLYARNRRKAR